MSHYSLLIIGEDPEGQLAPFDEKLEVPEYCAGEVSEKEWEMFEGVIGLQFPKLKGLDRESMYKEKGEFFNNGKWRKNSNGIWEKWSTSNPNGKWDWYVLGGRWTGFFKAKSFDSGKVGKPGVYKNTPKSVYHVDQLRMKELDLQGMLLDAEDEAREQFRDLLNVIGKDRPPKFNDLVEKHGGDLEKANKEWHENPIVKKMKANNLLPIFEDCWEYWADFDEEKFVFREINSCILPFAVLKYGNWYERAKMFMFGLTDERLGEDEWRKLVFSLLEDLDPDTLLSLYDCHI